MTEPDDPYSGVDNEKITKYQAGALEQRVLHLQTADPLRTPTYTLFPKPDYFFSTSGPNVSINTSFAYDHGYYSPNIDITWVGMVGPGVAANGVDGPQPADGNQAHDPESTKTVPQASQAGTWVEETDIRPTMLYLLGLTRRLPVGRAGDHAGPVARAAQRSRRRPTWRRATTQINSSVGQFATDTLIADSKALASGSASDDSAYAGGAEDAAAARRRPRPRRRRRSSRRSQTPRPGTVPNHGEIQSGLVAREGAAEAGAQARLAVARERSGGGATRPRPVPGGQSGGAARSNARRSAGI